MPRETLGQLTLREFKEQHENELKGWDRWFKEMKEEGRIRKCECGKLYTIGPDNEDHGACLKCRDAEGELIL